MNGRLATLLVAAGLATSAASCATERPASATAGDAARAAAATGATVVDVATARRLVAGGIRVVDVRTPDEFSTGHVPGAVNIPHDEMGKRHAEIGAPSTPVLLYCRSGRRSGIAGQTLRSLGFDRVYDFGPYDLWVQSEPRQPAPGTGLPAAAP
jgi:rhodanese-related sulfurtransferase